jgi:hypothetical protein
MVRDQEVMVKGVQIHRRINELSNHLKEKSFSQERVVLSPDIYFSLLEYTVLMNETQVDRELLLWELFSRNDLFFDTGTFQLRIHVDFFSPMNSVSIY